MSKLSYIIQKQVPLRGTPFTITSELFRTHDKRAYFKKLNTYRKKHDVMIAGEWHGDEYCNIATVEIER